MNEAAEFLDAETKAIERPGDHKNELRLWLRLLSCTTLIENEIRRRLHDSFDITLPRFDLMAQLDKTPGGMKLGELSQRLMVSNGNITGLANIGAELEPKRLELLGELVPGLARVAVLRDRRNGGTDLESLKPAATAMGVTLDVIDIHEGAKVDLDAVLAKHPQAVLALGSLNIFGRYDRVIIVPIAMGSSTIAALNSERVELITNALAKLKAAGLTPTHILFQQGEQDATLTTSAGQYVSQLHQLVTRFRAAGFDAPFYLSRSTKCDAAGPKNTEAVRAGQLSAISDALDIRQGPDTDTIGNDGRNPYDGCHMNEIGTLANAALWAAFIK